MKDVRDNPFSFLDDWYGRLEDIIEDLKEHNFDVLNATSEFIDIADKNDKEYVLKLGGTPKTITINKIECLTESTNSEKELCDKIVKQYLDGDNMSKIAADLNVNRTDVKVCIDDYMKNRKKNKVKKIESFNTLTEGGIYPVALVSGAYDAFLKVINEILDGDVTEVVNLELIPSLGFGGAGRYWYKANITIDEDTIINYINEENTPEAYRLMKDDLLIINPYSDIDITCSADEDSYYDGVTLDALSDSDADMKILNKESNIIGSAIITKLFEAEEKILNVLKQYEDKSEYDEIDESLIPIQEYWDENDWDDDELASIYGGDTSQSQKDIAEDEIAASKVESTDDWIEPKLGKRVKQLKGWKIYQGTDSSGDEVFRCFTPDEYRPEVGYEDWECETLEQAISWVQNYDLEESINSNNRINKEMLEDDSNKENDEMIVIEYITSGNDEEDIQRRLIKIKNAISYYENNNNDTLYNLIDKLEDEIEDLKDINMKKISKVDESTITLIEKDTFGNYEENVFTALDNIEFLASSYEELNKNTLGSLLAKLKDEIDTLEKIHMKLVTGIQEYEI